MQVAEIDLLSNGSEIQEALQDLTGRSTVPNIFIAGKSVGGYSDGPGVNTLAQTGELSKLLQAAKAI